MLSAIETSKKFTRWKILASAGVLVTVAFLGLTQSMVKTHGDRGKNHIALTLDDGPNPPYTERFLQLLEKEKVPATFFFIGRNIEIHRATALKVLEAGHEIGNHSYTHKRLAWEAWREIENEVSTTDKLIRSLGYTGPIAFRAPFGQRFGLLAFWLLFNGRANTLYDVAPQPPDYFRSSPVAISESSIERTRNGSILLLHDGEGIRIESLEAAARILPALKSKGFRFVRLSEL